MDLPVGATVTVLGASGKTGRAVAAAARARGLTVRGTTRDPGRLLADGARAVEPVAVDLATGEGLVEAFTGADAAYLVVPNVHPDEVGIVRRALRAADEAGVARLVYHSVADPDDRRMAHHLRKGEAEELLRAARPGTVVLRPAAYQQNLLPAVLAGRVEVPYRLDAPFSLVDLGDVAEVAADALTGRLPDGSTHVLGGPEELTILEVAETASRVLERPVEAAATTAEAWRAGPGAALPPSALSDLLAMFAAYDESGFTVDPAPLARLLGRPPTTWADLLTKETR
ncbi:NAD(P)H-binding protein [Ornithinimicrobium humiphilum]|uniref:SDR family oxidoreductase n=1 Tax=Ornithinimicrobium humiphilum TaxID=125288 RepID=UPI001EE356CD|nr:NmrA family NAD(P)-binding protein [Ornithinimicrobium humiphilum]